MLVDIHIYTYWMNAEFSRSARYHTNAQSSHDENQVSRARRSDSSWRGVYKAVYMDVVGLTSKTCSTMPSAIQRKLDRLIDRIRDTSHTVLQYKYEDDTLAVWFWWVLQTRIASTSSSTDQLWSRPTNEAGECVTPSDLPAYRLSNAMRGPCCLCPVRPQCEERFVEAAFYMPQDGRFGGEYVAVCADDICGYHGESYPCSSSVGS